jgi:thiol:disulfide interchange protein DsbD
MRSGRPDAPAIARARVRRPPDVRASLAAGRPVFVYFTADWCVTCQVNEACSPDPRNRRELDRSATTCSARLDAAATRRSAARSAALGKAGVPAYAVYTPSQPDHPRVLPELLTEEGLLDALREVAALDRS